MATNLRAVFDTNVFVAAALSHSDTSPTRELIDRWEREQFTLLTCEQLAQEIAEKLGERGIDDAVIEHYIATLAQLAEWITVSSESVVPVLPDPDDDVVLACAVLGRATHLVTYDPHFDILNGNYQEITILKALPFLWIVRGDKKPADE